MTLLHAIDGSWSLFHVADGWTLLIGEAWRYVGVLEDVPVPAAVRARLALLSLSLLGGVPSAPITLHIPADGPIRLVPRRQDSLQEIPCP